jgi:hypothetical protein
MKYSFFTFSDENRVYTKAENCTKNRKINFNQLVLKIKGTAPPAIGLTRATIKAELLKGNTFAGAKKAAAKHKIEIPYFLPSGFCPIHHNDKSLTDYNSIYQIDIDFKFIGGDLKSLEIKKAIEKIEYIALAAISPSSYGVKALALTTNDKKQNHAAVQKQLLEDLSKRLKIDIKNFDSLGLSQPCFIPYDETPYFRLAPVPFKVDTTKLNDYKRLEACNTFLDSKINVTGEAWDICSRFAKSKGFKINNGTNHSFITFFSICANLLGIQKNEVQKYVASTGINIGSNCIDYPYQTYNTSFGRWSDVLLFKSDRKIIQGKTGEKLSDILKGIPVDNTRIIAPTGTGKTFFSLLHIEGKKVVISPTVALVDNICNDDKYKHLNPLPIHENARNLEQVLSSDCIICTYASFRAVAEKLGAAAIKYKLIIDEYHNFTSSTAAHFRLDALTRVLRIAPRFKSIIMLSGTELFNVHPAINALPIIEIKVPKPKKFFKLINAISSTAAAAEQIKRAIKKGKFPMILFNDKGAKLEVLKELLKDYNIVFFNADNKQDHEFKKVVQSGIISNDVQGIISTTVINEGNNIYNKLNYHFIIYGMFHPSEIEQFCNRPRCPISVTGCIVRSNKRKEKTTFKFRASSYALWLKNSCENLCNEINTQNEINENLKDIEFYSRSSIQRMPIFKNDFGKYEIDYLQLNNFVFETEKTAFYKNDDLLKSELKRFNIEVLETVEHETELTKEAAGAAKDRIKHFKNQREKDYISTIDLLKNESYAYAYASDQLKQRKVKLKAGEKIAFNYYIELRDTLQKLGIEQNKDFIFEQLEQVGTKKAKLQLLKKRLHIKTLYSNLEYMDSNRMFAIIIKKIQKTITAGTLLSSEEINSKVVECLQIDKTFNLSVFEQERNNKAIDILKLFFDVTPVTARENGTILKKYKICNLIFRGEVLERLTKNKVTKIDDSLILQGLQL